MGGWSPDNLAVIEYLELKKGPNGDDMNLLIEALFQNRTGSWPDFDKPMYRVEILFGDVSGLSLKDFGGGCIQIMGFDITSVENRGMEEVNFQISDYEDSRIKFNSSTVYIKSATPA